MRVVVFGAGGAMAQVVLRDLLGFADDDGTLSITAVDLRVPVPRSDDPSVDPLADPRVRRVACDVRDQAATVALLEGASDTRSVASAGRCDVVASCVPYLLNEMVMQAALAARVPYCDLGGLYHGSLRQFALDSDFVAGGVAAVLGMGSTPGITNVMAGALARGLDAVEEAHVWVGCGELGAKRGDALFTGPLPVPYAIDTVLDEFALEPMVLVDGTARAVAPMSGAEIIDFPAPVGRMEAFFTLHSEVAMFPRAFPGLSAASFRVAFSRELVAKMRFLVELGFASRNPLPDPSLRGVTPRAMLVALVAAQQADTAATYGSDELPNDCDALLVEVVGRRAGRRCVGRGQLVALPHPVWRVAAGSLDTGVPLSIVAQMLARGEISQPGVLSPELAVPSERFFRELARRGLVAELGWHDQPATAAR